MDGVKFAVCRIVGNELPPRDTPGSKLESLEWVVKNCYLRNVHNTWVLNHIIDADYRDKVLSILVGQDVTDLPFDRHEYAKKKSKWSKVRYAVNINAARNHGVKYSRAGSDFVVCLDQDCFFFPDEWERVVGRMAADGFSKKYYGVRSKRIHVNHMDHTKVVAGEAMVIFRSDADVLFDEAIPFGKNSKVALLRKLGYDSEFRVSGDLCENVGWVAHLACGDHETEKDVVTRCDLRMESLDLLVKKLDLKVKLG